MNICGVVKIPGATVDKTVAREIYSATPGEVADLVDVKVSNILVLESNPRADASSLLEKRSFGAVRSCKLESSKIGADKRRMVSRNRSKLLENNLSFEASCF